MCSLWIVNYKHKFIIAINFFLVIGRFYIYFEYTKVPTMLLEKVSIHTATLFVHCYIFFFIFTCSFSVFVENCILLPKGINEFVVFLCIVHVWF